MTTAIVLMLLAEAATACAPGSGRLAGGAILVRPVGTSDPMPFLQLGPTESIVSRPDDIQQVAAPAEPEQADEAVPVESCAPVGWPIA